MTDVAAYVPDLMDRSRISAVAPDCRFVTTPEALVGLAVDVVVVDLRQPRAVGVLAELAGSDARVVAFASHVDTATIEAAKQAGCEQVLPRSVFFRNVAELLS